MYKREKRYFVNDIAALRKRIGELGGTYQGEYSFTDTIYVRPLVEGNLDESFIRLREYQMTNLDTKTFVLVEKTIRWVGTEKVSTIVSKREFSTRESANNFLVLFYESSLMRVLAFSRRGWEYHLNGDKIFVEEIEHMPPSVELETEQGGNSWKQLPQKLGLRIPIIHSVPKMVQAVIEKRHNHRT